MFCRYNIFMAFLDYFWGKKTRIKHVNVSSDPAETGYSSTVDFYLHLNNILHIIAAIKVFLSLQVTLRKTNNPYWLLVPDCEFTVGADENRLINPLLSMHDIQYYVWHFTLTQFSVAHFTCHKCQQLVCRHLTFTVKLSHHSRIY